MKKILTWSVIPAFNEYPVRKILADNLLGSNTGNLLFHSSVTRALMTDDATEFETIFSYVSKNMAKRPRGSMKNANFLSFRWRTLSGKTILKSSAY